MSTSLDEHLNSCCKEEDKVDKVHKDEDSRVHEHKFFIRKAVSFY